ncbi:MAG: L-threonylcarbamoyladenylate synthase [Thermonemataceae bacterium]
MYKETLTVLRNNKPVLIYTDIGWELACSIHATETIASVVQYIPYNESNPYTVLVAEIGLISNYASGIPEVAWDIIEYTQKPLTVIFDSNQQLPEVLQEQVGLRWIKEATTQKLIYQLGKPLFSVSLQKLTKEPPVPSDLEVAAILPPSSAQVIKHLSYTILKMGKSGEVNFVKR